MDGRLMGRVEGRERNNPDTFQMKAQWETGAGKKERGPAWGSRLGDTKVARNAGRKDKVRATAPKGSVIGVEIGATLPADATRRMSTCQISDRNVAKRVRRGPPTWKRPMGGV